MKLFLITLFLSLPFWWGTNILEYDLENFLSAQICDPIENVTYVSRSQIIKNREIEIQARSAISVKIDNQGNQKILFRKDEEKSFPIASLSKLMTALVFLENKEIYNVDQEKFLNSMLIESNNQSAENLAEMIGMERFINLMNEKAKELNLDNTNFINPTGLDPVHESEIQNFSSCKDLVVLVNYILENNMEIFEISSRQNEITELEDSSSRLLNNTNQLLDPGSDIIKEDDWWKEKILNNIIGGKTGYTEKAGGCIILVFKDGEDKYIDIVLGSKSKISRFEEIKKIIKFTRR